MFRQFLATAALIVLALPVSAECTGRDLFNAMPRQERKALIAAADAAPFAQGLLFRATRGTEVVTLAGTYHLPDPRHEALAHALAPALKDARELLVELGPQEEATLKEETTKDPSLLFITSGPTIPEMLPDAEWQRLGQALSDRGIPQVLGAKMRPAYLAMILAMPACAMPELAAGEGGLDKVLMREAGEKGVPVRALEPWNTIFAVFDKLTPEDSLSLLQGAMVDATDNGDNAVTMAGLYFSRKPRLIWEIGKLWAEQAGMPRAEVDRQMALSQDLLVDDRNRAWLPQIEAAAAQGPVLVAVGALHLSGDSGLLELLRRDGYRIERLD